MCDGASEAVEVFRLDTRDPPKRPLIRVKNPLRSLFRWWVSRKLSKSIAGTRTPFSSTICGWELKQIERLIGIVICSALGHEARGITGGRTDSNRRGSVPEILGRFDFGLSAKSPSMIISGCKRGFFKIEPWNFNERNYLDMWYHGYLRWWCRRRPVLEHFLEFCNFSVEVCHLLSIDTILYLNTVLQLSTVISHKAPCITLKLESHTVNHWIFLNTCNCESRNVG